MVSNLAGSLALVTCKEPLRVSIGNHMRSLLATTAPNADHATMEMLVQLCSSENLELGCMLIEKAATEKAMRDIDEAVAASLQVRGLVKFDGWRLGNLEGRGRGGEREGVGG